METPKRILRNLHLENVEKYSTPLKIPASPFMMSLGYGTGVNVYRLERSPKCGQMRSPWAVKRVSQRARQNGDDLFNARIQEEAEILRKLSHPNIVGFRCVTKANDGVDSLALECCNTSLGMILEERYDEDLGALPVKYTLKMANDIARALDYLHTEAKLLHGDIKSFNVLVKGDFEICKLCDFGVSLPLDANGLIKLSPILRYVGTDLWSAPEVMDESEFIDCKADIYSFGLVIYETIALIPPHTLNMTDNNDTADQSIATEDKSLDSAKENTFADSTIAIESACGTRPPLPNTFLLSDDYNIIVELFFCCTNELAEDRPTAKSISQNLENIQLNK